MADGIIKQGAKKPFKSDKSNLHCGHRERMRERYAAIGFDGFSDHEILEMVLFRCLPQGNTNEIAHELLDKFGTLDSVFVADPHLLMQVKGIKEQSALYLKFLYDLFCSFEKHKIDAEQTPGVQTDEAELLRFLFKSFYGKTEESMAIIFLNAAGEKIAHAFMGVGISNKMEVSIKQIVRESVRKDCAQIIIAHNHPNGLLIPSQADMIFTNTLSKRLNDVDVALAVHYLIVERSYLIIGDNHMCYPGRDIPE